MMAGMVKTREFWSRRPKSCRSPRSRFNEIDGRHVGTRTPDLYRVKVVLFGGYLVGSSRDLPEQDFADRVPFRDRQTPTSAHQPAHFQATDWLPCMRYVAGRERKEST